LTKDTVALLPKNNKTLNKNPVIKKKESIKPVIKTSITSATKSPPQTEKSNDFNEDDNDNLFEDENPIDKKIKSNGLNDEYEIDFNSEDEEKMKRKSLFLKNPRLLKNHIHKPVHNEYKMFRTNNTSRNNSTIHSHLNKK